jgi:GNAT superfamily N-acetyltransferase
MPGARRNAIDIRRAGAADVEALFEIRTSVVENHLTRQELAALGVTPEAVAALLEGDRTAAFLATDGDRTLGFSMARADLGDIFALFVRPEAQGAGLGSLLLAEAERWLSDKEVRAAWLLTGDGSGPRAASFYEKRGWRREGRQADGQIRFSKRLFEMGRRTTQFRKTEPTSG